MLTRHIKEDFLFLSLHCMEVEVIIVLFVVTKFIVHRIVSCLDRDLIIILTRDRSNESI